jgi:hypothetical protein
MNIKRHPSTTPLERWPRGWLVLETARLLDNPQYIVMTNDEKLQASYPVTEEHMRNYIQLMTKVK